MLVSTFELLLKPQLPKEADLPADLLAKIPVELKDKIFKLSRTVLQGYFLTISNLNAFDVTISLVFTVVSNPFVDLQDLATFLDVDGKNLFELPDLEPDLAINKIRYTRKIPASDTGLFLIQPNILKPAMPNKKMPGETIPALLDSENFEVRGYVEVFISSLSTGYNAAKLLITPEHRGTFYGNLNTATFQLDQIAYALPTAHGGSLFELTFQ